jgi:hypothetical protein
MREDVVPFLVTETSVKVHQCWVPLSFTPRIPSVLQFDFYQITGIKGPSELSHLGPVDITVVFISSFTDHIEVAQAKPWRASCRLAVN